MLVFFGFEFDFRFVFPLSFGSLLEFMFVFLAKVRALTGGVGF